MITARSTPVIDPKLRTYPVGTRIWIDDEIKPYRVRARNENFLVCTKPFNPRRTTLYCIIDLINGVRGPENFIFGHGAETDEQCEAMVRRLQNGLSEISSRRMVDLKTTRIEPPALKFREDFDKGDVVVYEGRREVFRCDEYKGSAEWAQAKYNLTDQELMVLYRSYKNDYDNQML